MDNPGLSSQVKKVFFVDFLVPKVPSCSQVHQDSWAGPVGVVICEVGHVAYLGRQVGKRGAEDGVPALGEGQGPAGMDLLRPFLTSASS